MKKSPVKHDTVKCFVVIKLRCRKLVDPCWLLRNLQVLYVLEAITKLA